MIYEVTEKLEEKVVVSSKKVQFIVPCKLKNDFYQEDAEYTYVDENFKIITLEVENHKVHNISVYQACSAQHAFEQVSDLPSSCSQEEWDALVDEFMQENFK